MTDGYAGASWRSKDARVSAATVKADRGERLRSVNDYLGCFW